MGFVQFKWKTIRASGTSVHTCPNCKCPKFDGDRWGYVYGDDTASPKRDMMGITCLECGCRILQSWYMANDPRFQYYEPVTQLTFWRHL